MAEEDEADGEEGEQGVADVAVDRSVAVERVLVGVVVLSFAFAVGEVVMAAVYSEERGDYMATSIFVAIFFGVVHAATLTAMRTVTRLPRCGWVETGDRPPRGLVGADYFPTFYADVVAKEIAPRAERSAELVNAFQTIEVPLNYLRNEWLRILVENEFHKKGAYDAYDAVRQDYVMIASEHRANLDELTRAKRMAVLLERRAWFAPVSIASGGGGRPLSPLDWFFRFVVGAWPLWATAIATLVIGLSLVATLRRDDTSEHSRAFDALVALHALLLVWSVCFYAVAAQRVLAAKGYYTLRFVGNSYLLDIAPTDAWFRGVGARTSGWRRLGKRVFDLTGIDDDHAPQVHTVAPTGFVRWYDQPLTIGEEQRVQRELKDEELLVPITNFGGWSWNGRS